MPARYLKLLTATLTAIFCSWSLPAFACTINPAPPTAQLGTHGSTTLADGILYTSTSTTGINCFTVLEVVSDSYIGLKIDGPIPPLKNTLTTDTIPLIVSASYNGPPLVGNTLYTDYGTTILGLLKSSGGNVAMHFRTTATGAVKAGIYEAELNVRWYFSVCLIGAIGICVPVNSDKLVRNCFIVCGNVSQWGDGEPVKMKIRLVVERDCKINAPPVVFGSRPLPDTFPIISQTVTIRCGVGAPYTVALDNGQNSDGETRRMRVPATGLYLEYDVFKGTAGLSRWGSSTAEVLSSALADAGAGVTNGLATQSYHYRAQIRPVQPQTPVVGSYKDTLTLSVIF